MTLANRLTMVRIGLAGLLFACLVLPSPEARIGAVALFAVAGLTDWLDGFIARRTGTQSPFGALADPLADKLLVLAALAAFLKIRELDIPAWVVFLTLARELIIGSLRALAAVRGRLLAADRWGKWKMGVQTGCILLILLLLALRTLAERKAALPGGLEAWTHFLASTQDWPRQLSYLLVAATWASGLHYLYRNRKLLQDSWG